MTMEISIQEGKPEHLSEIRDLILEWGYSASESQTREWLQALEESPNHQIFVAIANESVVGWAGVGRLLIQAIEDWSRTKGLSRVVVRSNVRRSESHEFYPSMGFELTKTSHFYMKDLNGPSKSGKTDT